MGADDKLAEFDKRVAERDAKFENPAQRALRVYKILHDTHPELTTWDLVCFSTEWLALMAAGWDWLKEPAKSINRIVYEAHYFMPEDQFTIGTADIGGIGEPPQDHPEKPK
jgi:hypothetical protein